MIFNSEIWILREDNLLQQREREKLKIELF